MRLLLNFNEAEFAALREAAGAATPGKFVRKLVLRALKRKK
ncbi:MAG: hypothetical protein WEF50_11150 [Myxococcota bacterium]